MKIHSRQAGMSLLGMLVIAVMVGFFVTTGLRLAPSYFEYLTVKDVVTRTATEEGASSKSLRDLRVRMETLLNTNQVYDVNPKDIEIYRKEGETFIDANYEARITVVGRIDAVMNFDDLLIQVGKPKPE